MFVFFYLQILQYIFYTQYQQKETEKKILGVPQGSQSGTIKFALKTQLKLHFSHFTLILKAKAPSQTF